MFTRIAALVLLLSGCCRSPYPPCCNYDEPVPIELGYDDAEASGAIVDEMWGNGVWWESFNDPQLVELMSHALAMNPKISILESQIRQAFGEVKVANSRLYPRLDLLFNFDFEQQTRTGQFPILPNLPFEFGQWTLQMNLYYDFDIWNKNKDRVCQYLGFQRASELDYEWGKLILALSVAENYFKWQITSEIVDLEEKLFKKQQEYYDLTIKLVKHNLANRLDYLQQAIDLERVQEDVSAFKMQQEHYEHALKALVGNFCERLVRKPISVAPFVPFHLPKCLTLDLVGRRPDIQSEVWLIESTRKGIDIARKDFYPDFDLTAFFGYETIRLEKLFSSASTNWLIGPALHLPIFHGGELSGNLLIAKEEFIQEVGNYNQMVINATKEILDAFSSLKADEAIYSRAKKEVDFLKKDVELQGLRIKHHLDSAFALIEKEIALLQLQIRTKLAEEQILGDILELIRSTGG